MSKIITRSKSKEFQTDDIGMEVEAAVKDQVPQQQLKGSIISGKASASTADGDLDTVIEEETKKEEEGEPQVGKKLKTNDEKPKGIMAFFQKKNVVEEAKTGSGEDGAKKAQIQRTLTGSLMGRVEKILPREFYTRDVVTLSRELLGKIIIRKIGNKVMRCRIVETEAYAGAIDKACHAYQNKKTAKTKPMFREGGHVYMFTIYVTNTCFNITASKEGDPSATLIRAVEIIDGFDLAASHRDAKKVSKSGKELTNGPGKLCAAMKLDKSFNEVDLTQKGDLYLVDDGRTFDVVTTKRINIDYAEEYIHKPWRFCIKDNPCVSVKADPVPPEPL